MAQNSPKETVDSSRYSLTWSDSERDTSWDSFLASEESGHHVQSSMWSQVKAFNGWDTKRLIVRCNDSIAGGAQMLFRRVRFVGKVGYVPKGPVLGVDDDELATQLLQQLREIAASENLKVLFVQPSAYGAITRQLNNQPFRTSPIETAPTATLLVDLSPDLDEILAKMSKSMRNGVRRSQRRGISVRIGSQDDLPTFLKLLTVTSQRQGFSTFELEYFQQMWDTLEPTGNFKLFVAELEGEPVSAQFCIPFGSTVVAKQIGWSGKHRHLHPNEALDWFTIQWAKQNGFRFYDLEGIEREVAETIVNKQSLPEAYANKPTAYKLRMGGDVALNPSAYCYISNPVFRSVYNKVGFRVAKWPAFQNAAGRFRTS